MTPPLTKEEREDLWRWSRSHENGGTSWMAFNNVYLIVQGLLADLERAEALAVGYARDAERIDAKWAEEHSARRKAEADNAEMFKALEGQTTLGLQMAGKWEKAEADLQQATSLLAQDERMREDFIARLDRVAADLQIEQQQHAIARSQRDEAKVQQAGAERLAEEYAASTERIDAKWAEEHSARRKAEDRLARVVGALDWYDSATKNPDFWCPVKQGFFAPRYHSEDVECSGCGQWFAVERGVHDDAEVDHFFSLIRAAAKGEPSGD